MALGRFLLWSTVATLVVLAGVVVGTGVAGAVMGPAVEQRLAEQTAAADSDDVGPSCPIDVRHEVGYDAGARTYALRAVELSAPACPPGTRVTVAIDGRRIGSAALDEDGAARLELADPVPAAAVEGLQVTAVS